MTQYYIKDKNLSDTHTIFDIVTYINSVINTRRVATFTQKINCLHIISAKKIVLLALKNIITDMGRIPLVQYN